MSPLAEQIKECLACETKYKASDAILAGVSIIYAEQYCSPACEQQFEAYLEEQVANAAALGKIEQKLSEDDVRKIVNNFHLKLTKEK